MVNATTAEILMVDDDDLDFELFQRSLVDQRIANPVHRAVDGVDALNFLQQRAEEDHTSPLIVLMDINMPRMNGIECLRELRSNPKLKSTVVFMLTTSDNDLDVIESYELNVTGYMVKGKIGEAFVDGVKMLDRYWRIVELPPVSAG